MSAARNVDVLVIGSGAAGLTAAFTARKLGLDVLLVEKDTLFGGTTAVSGGQVWIPGNHHAKAAGREDSREAVTTYLKRELGNYYDAERVDMFLDYGPQMLRFIEGESRVRWAGSLYPDYHPAYEGFSLVRSVATLEGDPAEIDRDLLRHIKPILPQTVYAGIAVGSSIELKQLMQAGSSIGGMKLIASKLLRHWKHVLKYGRGEPVVRGRALVARLAQSCKDIGVELRHSSAAKRLLVEDGRVTGAELDTPEGKVTVHASKTVVLAAGGFTKDPERRKQLYSHVAAGKSHAAPTSDSNEGGGQRLGEQAGGVFSGDVSNPGAWVPVSVIPGRKGADAVFPHLIDRQKPGFIAVTRRGKRFTNEAGPYHDFVQHLVRANEDEDDSYCWLIAHKPAFRKYGMGYVKPAPIPYGEHIKSGYIKTGATIAELAAACGIDAPALERTVAAFNANARMGIDPDFHRGQDRYDAYQGDETHKPNACLGPLETGPFFAVKVIPGDLGTFAGLVTDKFARVLDPAGAPVSGLYAVGNDQRSVFAGTYPGPGSTIGPGMTFAYVAAHHMAGQIG